MHAAESSFQKTADGGCPGLDLWRGIREPGMLERMKRSTDVAS